MTIAALNVQTAPAETAPPNAFVRGPFRPRTLVSARTRHAVRNRLMAFRLVDGALVAAAVVLGAFRYGPWALAAAGAGGAVTLAVLTGLGTYRFGPRERDLPHLLKVLAAVALGVLWPLVLSELARLPMTGALTVFAATASALVAAHIVWRALVRRWRAAGLLTPSVVIVGATDNAARLIEGALKNREVAVLGLFDDRAARAPERIHGVPVLGDVEALLNHKILPSVDRIVIAVTARAEGRVRRLVERLSVLPNEINLFVDIDGEADHALERLADAPLTRLAGAAHDEQRAFAKRLADIVLGSIALVAAAPIMLATALAIRLDSPGPILFRQRRHGFNNEEIVVWKFRSMRHEASDAKARRQVSANDDRVTRVGRFIRKTSLDELPQIFNVLKGEMSLVGPRPHAIGMMTGDEESARLVAEYAHRHRMKPGMTGWAAIKGSRGPVDTPESVRRRVALDVEYIERQSFWLDLYIMAVTIPCLLGDSEAVR